MKTVTHRANMASLLAVVRAYRQHNCRIVLRESARLAEESERTQEFLAAEPVQARAEEGGAS